MNTLCTDQDIQSRHVANAVIVAFVDALMDCIHALIYLRCSMYADL